MSIPQEAFIAALRMGEGITMPALARALLFTLAGLLVLAFVISELRRGATGVAGIEFTRRHAPLIYSGMVLTSILVVVAAFSAAP